MINVELSVELQVNKIY